MTSRIARRARHRRHKAKSGSRKPRLLWSVEHVDLGEQQQGYLLAEVRVVPFIATGNQVRPARDDEAESMVVRTSVAKMGEPLLDQQLRMVELVQAWQKLEMRFLHLLRPYRGKRKRPLAEMIREGLQAVDMKQAQRVLDGHPIQVRRK